MKWEALLLVSEVELGFLQVDIVGHSKFVESDKTTHRAKAIFRSLVEGMRISDHAEHSFRSKANTCFGLKANTDFGLKANTFLEDPK